MLISISHPSGRPVYSAEPHGWRDWRPVRKKSEAPHTYDVQSGHCKYIYGERYSG